LGNDDIHGGGGNDLIDAVDGSGGDVVRCGSGNDRVAADEGDTVFSDCEEVVRIPDGTTPPDNGETDCSDGLDNDGDGKTDFPDDPGCSSASDPSEVDGDDDDGDDDGHHGNGKVILCHKPDTPAEKTKKVPEAAVAGHLGHGDTLGPCDDD